jgi:hypothetical protein
MLIFLLERPKETNSVFGTAVKGRPDVRFSEVTNSSFTFYGNITSSRAAAA